MFEVKKIVKDTTKEIRKHSKEVELPLSKEDEELCEYLITHLEKSQNDEEAAKLGLRAGVGIAACQVGEFKQIFAMLVDEGDGKVTKHVLVNPKIVSESVKKAYLEGGEGCLSVDDDHQGYIFRKYFVRVEAYDYLTKSKIYKKFQGYLAIVVQHEMDHFKGVLYYDHIDKKNPLKFDPDAIAI